MTLTIIEELVFIYNFSTILNFNETKNLWGTNKIKYTKLVKINGNTNYIIGK